MRISAFFKRASRASRRAVESGFTLIEITVVLVIIGVIVGLATISLAPNPASVVEREGRRLQAVLMQASEEAMLQGVELALALSKEPETGSAQYQLLILDKQALQWRRPDREDDMADSKLWAAHTMAEQIDFSLDLEGERLSEQELDHLARMRGLVGEEDLLPSILLLSSGELTPFTLRLVDDATDYTVTVSSDGFSGVFVQ